MKHLKFEEKINTRGFLLIREGELEIEKYKIDKFGNKVPEEWTLHGAKDLSFKENKIAFKGWQFVKSKGWDIALAIAVGNGSTSGGDAPANTDTQLKAEFTNGRFICPGSGDSRVNLNQVALYALWPRAQGTNSPITEWGLFGTERGSPILNKDSGLLISRIAYNFTRTNSTKDVEITWLIVDTN